MKPQREPQVLLYQTDNGTTYVEVRMAGETVWLNQNQMTDLFLHHGNHLMRNSEDAKRNR